MLNAAERAGDGVAEPQTLALLGEFEPQQLTIKLMPGTAVLVSAWPVVALHLAHHEPEVDSGPERIAGVRAALAEQRGEAARVWRDGLRARVTAIDAADNAFAFELWLPAALRQGWFLRAELQG